MEIENMMVAALYKIKADGLIEKTIQETMEKTIKDIVNDLFRSYSDFGKDLKEKLSNAVKVNLEQIDLPLYNVMIENSIKEQATKIMTDEHAKLMTERLKGILSIEEKKEWKLSEILEKLKEEVEESEIYENNWEKMSFHIDDDRSSLAFISFDTEPDKEKYQCKYRLVLHCDTWKIHSIDIDDYKSKSSSDKIVATLHGFEELFFRLYSQGCTIKIDDCDDATYYPDPY